MGASKKLRVSFEGRITFRLYEVSLLLELPYMGRRWTEGLGIGVDFGVLALQRMGFRRLGSDLDEL